MAPPVDSTSSSTVSSLQPSTTGATAQGAWWCGSASTESELLSAAVLCAAIGAASSSSNTSSSNNNDDGDLVRARQELETRIRQSPLPHDLLFPVLEFRRDFVLMETSRSILCAVRATAHRDILETVLGSTLPLTPPFEYRFGGARIHVPFWKRAQRLDLQAAHRRARRAKKTLLLCGHSIGGSIAQLGFCELVYQHLPINVRLQMEKLDYEQKQKDKLAATDIAGEAYSPGPSNRSTIYKILEAYPDRTALAQSLPNVLAVGFGSPYSSSYGISSFLEPFGLNQRMITFVNEQDCIPGILNVAQSAAMLAKTTERIVTITKATKTLLNLLPARMQQVLIGLSSTAAAGAASTSGGHSVFPSATTAYITMSLNMLQNSFQKLREYNVVKDTSSLQYAPCGTYIFLSKSGSSFQVFHDTQQIVDALNAESDATTTLTGNSILQHLMSAYVDAVAKRSTSIQINATMNYYERLSVARNATQREIRSAYRSLALKWHPDRWSQSQPNLQEREMAETIFKLLAEAYEVLSDPVARKEYDAHLAKAPSLTEEFVRNGTVYGKTLDEAIATFREMFDRGSGLVSRATSRFSSSSSSVVGQPIRRTQTDSGSLLVKNNHDNLFAPDRIRVARKVGIGAEQQDKIMYLQPEELVPGDLPAPRGGGSGKVGLKTISVVGGAVAVGASIALIVSAWSQFSESSKRQRQAETVRSMSGNHLLLLMEDHINLVRAHKVKSKSKAKGKTKEKARVETKPTVLQLDSGNGQQQQPTIPGDAEAVSDAIVATTSELVVNAEDEDDNFDDALSEFELIDEFYDCVVEFDAAELEAFAEDEFYECVDLTEDIAAFFDIAEEQEEEESQQVSDIVLFPEGSAVSTPFGLGIVEKWRDGSSSAVIRFTTASSALHVGYIQKCDLSRGAALALQAASESLEAKRTALAERVIVDYQLDESKGAKHNFQEIVRASKDGALDSGIRAAGGVVLAKGMARTSTALGGAVAAPLTIASILVDIGKEYYEYRTKHTERKSQGVLSETSERLLMKGFRLKAGQHIAGGTAAAAGASLGAYSVASAVGFWTGVGIAGPLGVVAATGAAVVGGMLGFFAGTKAYNGYTASYFNSHKYAKEHIDRLELGARIMFNEYDPEANGEISKEHCIQIMTKLYEASSAVSEDGYQQTVDVLQSEGFEGPVTWGMFWEWVSTEAARSLRALEHEESKPLSEPVPGEGSWWSSYMKYFSYGSLNGAVASTPKIAAPQSCMYASVAIVLGYKFQEPQKASSPAAAASSGDVDTTSEDDGEVGIVNQEDAENLVVLRAQLEALVNSGDVTVGDSFQLSECLDSEDFLVRESARKTIEALQSGQIDSGGLITEGFSGGDATSESGDSGSTSALVTESRADAKRPETTTQAKKKSEKELKPQISKEEQEVDVLCSLLSTQGLREFLHAHNIAPTDARRTHEDLHCLALQVATKASAVGKPQK